MASLFDSSIYFSPCLLISYMWHKWAVYFMCIAIATSYKNVIWKLFNSLILTEIKLPTHLEWKGTKVICNCLWKTNSLFISSYQKAKLFLNYDVKLTSNHRKTTEVQVQWFIHFVSHIYEVFQVSVSLNSVLWEGIQIKLIYLLQEMLDKLIWKLMSAEKF